MADWAQVAYNVAYNSDVIGMEKPDKSKGGEKTEWSAWALAWELGWQIALPLVGFALVGRFADKYLGTTPWLLVAGVVLAASFTSFLVYRKIKKILDP